MDIKLTTHDKVMLAGAAAMAIGTFLPIVRLPILGTINYLAGGRGDGMIVLGLSMAIAALVIFQRRWFAVAGAVAALAVMFTTIIKVLGVLADARAGAVTLAKDNPFGGLANVFVQGVGFDFGWVALVGGAIAVLGAGLMAPREFQPQHADVLRQDEDAGTDHDEVFARLLQKHEEVRSRPQASLPATFGKRR